jgi:lysophospholipase L1-like esterase
MWRYAKELKVPDEALGHIHVANRTVELQNVRIAINSWGMRGPEPLAPSSGRQRILFLGSSITLGWGVAEEDTLAALVQRRLGDRVEVLNAGIGNYNAERYVNLYTGRLQDLTPSIVVVHYFLRDAEVLPRTTGNFLMRNSQLALMLWQAASNVIHGRSDLSGLTDHYRAMYAVDSEGRRRMEQALSDLDAHARQRGTRVVLAHMPDIHSLNPYPFGFVNDHMRGLAQRLGWTYVDLLDAFRDVQDPRSLYAIPGDPHPNAAGHARMANVLVPVLSAMIVDGTRR